MGEKEAGTVDVRVRARPSRLTRPIALGLRIGRALRLKPSRDFEDRVIRWLIDRSDVELETVRK